MTSQTVLFYILKTIFISSLFVTYYWLALRDKKFHYYNRFYLLSASVISLIAPLLNLNWFSVEEPVIIYRSSGLMQFVLPTTTRHSGITLDWSDYVLVIASLITLTLLGFLLMHIIKIQLLKKKWEVTNMEGFDFINTNEENAPFSFLNNLFWKQSISLQEEGGQQIFKHEITHIQQKHTWDRIYCQIIASVFWMNPFNWIIQKELVAIHEFIADEEAVGNSNVEAFAKMLLQTHYGNHFLSPTHSFFYSSIKRRLIMLTTTKNTKYSYLRRVMVLPIFIVTICLVSIKVNASEKIENKLTIIKDHIEAYIGDTTQAYLSDTTNPTDKSGLNALPIPPIPPKPSLVSPIYFIDGVKITEQQINAIPLDNIKSVNILNLEQAIKKYPEDGKNGVVEIFLKELQRKDQLPNKEWSNIIANQNAGIGQNQVRRLELASGVNLELKGSIDTNNTKLPPLFVLDGLPIKNISTVPPNEIESISVLKDAASTSLYGNAGKNGVVLITTKKGIKGNLQHKMEDVTVIGYGNIDKDGEAEITVFNTPKIQKNADPSKNNDPIFYTAQKPAEFPGGSKAWTAYLMKNLDRDLPYRNKAVPGKYTIKLNFVVNKNGDVKNVIAENNPGFGTAAEAIRVIENGPKWIPAEQNGINVNYLVKQTIVFTVSKE